MEEQTTRELKIVIAEDNEALAEIYKTRLGLIGYRCFVATDGQQALELIEQQRPDLVLLDMMMPKVAGDEVLRRMRASEWGKETRVFIISNLNEQDAPQGLRDYNIEGYMVKMSMSDDDLDQLVNNILMPSGQDDDGSLEAPGTQVL